MIKTSKDRVNWVEDQYDSLMNRMPLTSVISRLQYIIYSTHRSKWRNLHLRGAHDEYGYYMAVYGERPETEAEKSDRLRANADEYKVYQKLKRKYGKKNGRSKKNG